MWWPGNGHRALWWLFLAAGALVENSVLSLPLVASAHPAPMEEKPPQETGLCWSDF